MRSNLLERRESKLSQGHTNFTQSVVQQHCKHSQSFRLLLLVLLVLRRRMRGSRQRSTDDTPMQRATGSDSDMRDSASGAGGGAGAGSGDAATTQPAGPDFTGTATASARGRVLRPGSIHDDYEFGRVRGLRCMRGCAGLLSIAFDCFRRVQAVGVWPLLVCRIGYGD